MAKSKSSYSDLAKVERKEDGVERECQKNRRKIKTERFSSKATLYDPKSMGPENLSSLIIFLSYKIPS